MPRAKRSCFAELHRMLFQLFKNGMCAQRRPGLCVIRGGRQLFNTEEAMIGREKTGHDKP